MKKMPFWLAAFLLAPTFFFAPLQAQKVNEKPSDDGPTIDSLCRRFGMAEGQVMDIAWTITDGNGPRLTGSPGLDKATATVQKMLRDWGLKNVHTEEWGPFGRGWTLKNWSLEASSPMYFPLLSYPKAWSSTARGEGEVVYLDASKEADLERFRGKLKGKVVLLDTIRALKEQTKPLSERLDDKALLELANEPAPRPAGGKPWNPDAPGYDRTLWQFLYDEQPMLILTRHFKGDYGTLFTTGARGRNRKDAWTNGKTIIPQATVAIEQYNRLFRMLKKGEPLKIKLNLEADYNENDPMERNVVAEIAGSDKADEIVMLGAHLDSWHTGTGATDNGAGSAMMLETVRILQKIIETTGQKPRRTIRLALWTGEEQGLLGSSGYCNKHFVVKDSNDQIVSKTAENAKISAYFNLDNGSGKVRGVHLQGNTECWPIFREWLEPWEKHGASTLTMGNTGGTDHLSFDKCGIPGFQFIQDGLEYFPRTHHSNMDTWEHLIEADMKQAAAITAYFVWQTAMREEMLPRKE